jgi:CoA:oxalate CoA-transferase
MTGPYKDLQVVELGRFIAAPYCGQLFADGGADVIKVEPVTGDDARRNGTRLSSTEARQFLNKNRGKRSLAVNLADNRALSAVQTLLHEADVAITNFRPGQAKRLGLDYASIRATNPRIVYAENSAFGPKGPLAGKPGMDILLQAYAGIAPLSESGPAVFGDPIVDYTAAMLMAWGIATALYNRERTGEGQQLDVSLLQAALVIQNNSVNHIDAVDGWRTEFCDYLTEAFGRGATMGEILAQRETLKPTINPPYYGFFQTSDGYIAIAAGGRGLQVRVAQLLGVNDPTLTDDDYQPADIAAHTAAMRAQTAAVVIEHPTELWPTRRAFAAQRSGLGRPSSVGERLSRETRAPGGRRNDRGRSTCQVRSNSAIGYHADSETGRAFPANPARNRFERQRDRRARGRSGSHHHLIGSCPKCAVLANLLGREVCQPVRVHRSCPFEGALALGPSPSRPITCPRHAYTPRTTGRLISQC